MLAASIQSPAIKKRCSTPASNQTEYTPGPQRTSLKFRLARGSNTDQSQSVHALIRCESSKDCCSVRIIVLQMPVFSPFSSRPKSPPRPFAAMFRHPFCAWQNRSLLATSATLPNWNAANCEVADRLGSCFHNEQGHDPS